MLSYGEFSITDSMGDADPFQLTVAADNVVAGGRLQFADRVTVSGPLPGTDDFKVRHHHDDGSHDSSEPSHHDASGRQDQHDSEGTR